MAAAKAIAALVLGCIFLAMCLSYSGREDPADTTGTEMVDTTTVRRAESTPTASPEELLARRLAAATTLQDALTIAEPSMGDSQDDVNAGTAMLALWAAGHLELGQVRVGRNETSVKAVLKDADAERGKRMCVKGSVGQIGKDTSVPGSDLFVGQLRTSNWDFIRFYAAGSTAGIVEDTRTRFCGVVTGRFSFSNAMGGTTHTAELVGMFDIPANRAAPTVDVERGPPPGAKCLDPKEYTEYGARDLGLPLCGRATARPKREKRAQPAEQQPEEAAPMPAPTEAGEGSIDPFAGDPE